MPSTFGGIEIASRALSAQQSLVDLTGHNIANVNTPGYSRQRADLAATPPDSLAGVANGQIGTGVEITAITRVCDLYLDQRLLTAQGEQSRLNQLRDSLDRIQNTYLEPGSSGINNQLTAFFNSFQDLSNSPESSASRSLVRSQGAALSGQFNQLAAELKQLDDDLSGKLRN